MKKAIVLLLLTTIGSLAVMADKADKASLKQIKRIEVLALDTINGYTSVYAYPDENLNDLFAQQMDSLYHSWYIQNSYDVNFFEDEAESSELASFA